MPPADQVDRGRHPPVARQGEARGAPAGSCGGEGRASLAPGRTRPARAVLRDQARAQAGARDARRDRRGAAGGGRGQLLRRPEHRPAPPAGAGGACAHRFPARPRLHRA